MPQTVISITLSRLEIEAAIISTISAAKNLKQPTDFTYNTVWDNVTGAVTFQVTLTNNVALF